MRQRLPKEMEYFILFVLSIAAVINLIYLYRRDNLPAEEYWFRLSWSFGVFIIIIISAIRQRFYANGEEWDRHIFTEKVELNIFIVGAIVQNIAILYLAITVSPIALVFWFPQCYLMYWAVRKRFNLNNGGFLDIDGEKDVNSNIVIRG